MRVQTSNGSTDSAGLEKAFCWLAVSFSVQLVGEKTAESKW